MTNVINMIFPWQVRIDRYYVGMNFTFEYKWEILGSLRKDDDNANKNVV